MQSQVFWNEVTTGVTVTLRSVSNIDAVNAWVCGDNGTVLKTTNNGYNWQNVSGGGLPANINLVNIYGASATAAFTAGMVGTNTFVYRTTNGGTNWVQVFTQANGYVNGIWMYAPQSGIIAGNPVGGRWSLFRTTNGGNNWDSAGLYLPRNGSESGYNNSLWMHNFKIWFGTNNSRIYHYNMLNWSVQSTAPEVNSYIVMLDSSLSQFLGFAGGASLLKTTNAGTLWSPVTTPSTGNFSGAVVKQSVLNVAWYVRSGTSIYYSFNPYTSWSVQYTAPAGNYNHIAITRSPYFGPGYIYAVRSNGGITRGNLMIEGVKLISNTIPDEFKLYQNYPNPFNPSTKIKFNLPMVKVQNPGEIRGALLRIKVYDALGREIETMVDQVTQPGIYEDSWDGNNYPSGVYYYQLTIIDPKYNTLLYRATKKMILIK